MNPKSLNDLDPKLKETYERVMGTSVGGNPLPPPTMETQPVAPQPLAAPEPAPQPVTQAGTPAPSQDENSNVAQVFRADTTPQSPATDTASPSSKVEKPVKKASGKKPVLIIVAVGAVVFFAVYAVLWAKLLGLF